MSQTTLLITGGCGYLGAHLIRELAARPGAEAQRLRLLDNLSAGSVRALMDLPPGPQYAFLEADLLSPGALRAALEGVDAVLHLAAVVRTPFAFDQPASVTQVNHWGTVQLLERCREAGVKRLIYASSASVYGPGEALTESAPCRPLGPYSCAKHQGEQAVLAAQDEQFATTVLRLGTLYGGAPGLTRFEAIPNRFVYLAGTGRSLSVYGCGQQRRPLLAVRDAARALIWALEQPASAGEVYNVVRDNPRIAELADWCAAQVPGARLHYTDQDYREQLSLSLNGEKLRAAGFVPSESLETALSGLLGHFVGLRDGFS